MSDKREYLRKVATWLNDLAELTAGNTPLAETKAKIGALAAAIAQDDHPIEAFCKESLYAISRQRTFFPTYAELHEALTAWWGANRPKTHVPLPGGDDASLTGDDMGFVMSWNKNCAEYFANSGARGDERARKTICLGIARRHSPRAFRYIVNVDTDAASIAVQHGWDVNRPTQREHTLEEATHVKQLTDEVVTELGVPRAHRTSPPTDQPHRVSEVAAHFAKIQAQFEADHGRKMGALTPDQVADAYVNQPLARRPIAAAMKPPARKTEPDLPTMPPPANDLWVPPWERHPT